MIISFNNTISWQSDVLNCNFLLAVSPHFQAYKSKSGGVIEMLEDMMDKSKAPVETSTIFPLTKRLKDWHIEM